MQRAGCRRISRKERIVTGVTVIAPELREARARRWNQRTARGRAPGSFRWNCRLQLTLLPPACADCTDCAGWLRWLAA